MVKLLTCHPTRGCRAFGEWAVNRVPSDTSHLDDYAIQFAVSGVPVEDSGTSATASACIKELRLC
jgi:hypothetical protein